MRVPDSRSVSTTDVAAARDARRQFEAVCIPFRADLHRFIFWLCRDRTLVEDVVQETLLRAWRSFSALADREAARPWLLTIARRELARLYERKHLDTVDIDRLTETDVGALQVKDAHDVQEMRQAMMQLEPSYREPLVLQVLFGYSTQEIAKHMELGVGAVLTRLYRARQMLRRQMRTHMRIEESC